MKIYSLAGRQRAQVFIAALIVMAVVLTLGGALLFHSRSFRNISRLQADTDQAYSLARSGIGIAESFIANNNPCEDSTLNETYSLGQGTITVEIDPALRMITSTGKSGGSVRVLTKRFNLAPAPIVWAKGYGGFTTRQEWLNSFQQTSDGGYILVGTSNSFDPTGEYDWDVLLIKTDADGNVGPGYPGTWAKTYGSASSNERIDSSGEFLQQTSDGGYIFGGVRIAGIAGLVFIKTFSNGDLDWAKTYGSIDVLTSIQKTTDGGYILGAAGARDEGAGRREFFIIKIYSNGNLDWAKAYGGVRTDELYSLQQTSDGYILGGHSDTFRTWAVRDWLVIKTDAGGNLGPGYPGTWAKTYGSDSSADYFGSLRQTSDGYILGGSTRSFGAANRDYFVIKTDAGGDMVWAKTYGGTDTDSIMSLRQTSDGGYILGGNSRSFSADGYPDLFVIKTDADGDLDWARTYGARWFDYLYNLYLTPDGGYILGGQTDKLGGARYSDFLLIKTDSSGDLCGSDITQDITSDPNLNVNDVTSQVIQDDTPSGNYDTGITVTDVTPIVTDVTSDVSSLVTDITSHPNLRVSTIYP